MNSGFHSLGVAEQPLTLARANGGLGLSVPAGATRRRTRRRWRPAAIAPSPSSAPACRSRGRPGSRAGAREGSPRPARCSGPAGERGAAPAGPWPGTCVHRIWPGNSKVMTRPVSSPQESIHGLGLPARRSRRGARARQGPPLSAFRPNAPNHGSGPHAVAAQLQAETASTRRRIDLLRGQPSGPGGGRLEGALNPPCGTTCCYSRRTGWP